MALTRAGCEEDCCWAEGKRWSGETSWDVLASQESGPVVTETWVFKGKGRSFCVQVTEAPVSSREMKGFVSVTGLGRGTP